MMKKYLLIFVLLGFTCQFIFAQTGHYFLSHYKPGNDNISYLSFDIRQDNNGILYFANRSGVLQFDGRTWTMVPVIGVYSLAVTKSGEVYASGITGFGKIGLNQSNELSYISLSDSLPKAKNIFASLAYENVVYFLSESHLYEYNTETRVARILFSANVPHGAFTSIFRIGQNLYLNTEKGGLKKIQEEILMATGLPQLQKKEIVFVERSPDKKTDLIATGDSHFFMLKEGQPLSQFRPADSLYLFSNVVANGTWVTDKLVAIGTQFGLACVGVGVFHQRGPSSSHGGGWPLLVKGNRQCQDVGIGANDFLLHVAQGGRIERAHFGMVADQRHGVVEIVLVIVVSGIRAIAVVGRCQHTRPDGVGRRGDTGAEGGFERSAQSPFVTRACQRLTHVDRGGRGDVIKHVVHGPRACRCVGGFGYAFHEAHLHSSGRQRGGISDVRDLFIAHLLQHRVGDSGGGELVGCHPRQRMVPGTCNQVVIRIGVGIGQVEVKGAQLGLVRIGRCAAVGPAAACQPGANADHQAR